MSYKLSDGAYNSYVDRGNDLFDQFANNGKDVTELGFDGFIQKPAIEAAIAIDREAIALDWIKDQWVSFEEKDKLIVGEQYLLQLKNDEYQCGTENVHAIWSKGVSEEHYYAMCAFSDLHDLVTEWLRAIPLKVLWGAIHEQ